MKTKSRVVDLFLLPKLDAIVISKNFPNNKDTNINFNLDLTKNSELSFLERKPSFINNNFNKNKLYIEYNNKKKNALDSFEKELTLLDGSINSYNSNYPNSDKYNNNKKEKSLIKQKGTKDLNQITQTKTLNKNFIFKFDENNKNNILSPKKCLSIQNKSSQSIFKKNNEQYKNKRINKVIKDEINYKNSIDDNNFSNDSNNYYEQKTEEIIKDYNDLKFITLS